MGLDSLYQKVATSNGGGHASLEQYQEMMEGLKDRVRRLLDMTHTGIDDLRGYVRGLTQAERAEASLLTSLRRYGEKVKSATGIDVEVKTDGQLLVTDRLAAEVFQMIAEGLSNIRRHTHSPWAKIELASADGSLVVRVENDGAGDMPRLPFMPQSIAQRAEALGGRARVERGGGRTIVIVEIPL